MALFVVVLRGILLVVHSFGFILWWFLYCIAFFCAKGIQRWHYVAWLSVSDGTQSPYRVCRGKNFTCSSSSIRSEVFMHENV